MQKTIKNSVIKKIFHAALIVPYCLNRSDACYQL